MMISEKLMRGEDVVKYITAQRIKRLGHLNRMEETKTVKKITEWNAIGKSYKGRPKNRWKYEVLSDLKTLKVKKWTYLVKDRKACCKLVQKTETHKVDISR
jgi:hypothetical protein